MTKFTAIGQFLNFATFLLVIAAIWKKTTSRWLLGIIFLLLAVQVVLTGALEGGNIQKQLAAPLGTEYTTDMRAFLKTYQLMEQGRDFYPAFATGMAGLHSGSFHPDINAWRQPFVFYLWKVLPGDGRGIYYLWQTVIILDLFVAYKIARKFLPTYLAILSPFILWPYFHYSLVDLTILQPEWWGLSFFLFGLGLSVYRRFVAAGMFFALALAARELFIVPVAVLLILERKNWRQFVWPLVLFATYYLFYHLPNAFRFPTEILRTTRHGNLSSLHSLFAYSSWSYFLGQLRPFVILTVLSFLSLWWQRQNRVFLTTFLPFLVFAAILAGTGSIDETRDYWGIYFVPLLLISIPILILPPGK